LKRKTKTEKEFIQFKISTNRESSDFLQIEPENQNGESSDFLHIETENQNRKKIYPIQDFNKPRNFRLFTN